MTRGSVLLVALLLASPAAAQPTIQPAVVRVANSPNVLAWPVTTHITRLELADAGVRVTFDRCDVWPDVTPPGWDGPLRFTLWLVENIGGEWFASGIIQFWACDQFNGGAVYRDNQIARNWVYDARWSSMVGHQPRPGERIGFLVSAGNARGQDDHGVAERSDIVEVLMPSAAAMYPPFAATEHGVEIVTPVVVGMPPPGVDGPDISVRLDALEQQLVAAVQALEAHDDANTRTVLAKVEAAQQAVQKTSANLLTRILTLGMVR